MSDLHQRDRLQWADAAFHLYAAMRRAERALPQLLLFPGWNAMVAFVFGIFRDLFGGNDHG